MTVLAHPNRTLCRRNVLIRRGDLLVCCNNLEAQADVDWHWQRFICRDGVRARRGNETVWADTAEFSALHNEVVLTGHAVLRRGDSLLQGRRVTVDLDSAQARIARPQGYVQSGAPLPPAGPLPAAGLPLPPRCPIDPLPAP